jgi:5,6-dimethylbenzimidazole synthase
MDVFEAIRGRRSCRKFLPEPIAENDLDLILEAATWAPSAANNQPWEFIVVSSADIKQKILTEALERKQELLEKSGWKWLDRYQVGFLLEAPVILAVVGNPKKSGADLFMEGRGESYAHGCVAAIQNILLSAHALGLGSLWFTLFDRKVLRDILSIEADKDPIALILLGKAAAAPQQTPRVAFKDKVRYLK